MIVNGIIVRFYDSILKEDDYMDGFVNYAEIQAEKAEKLLFCRGIKLLHIRDRVEVMLGFIGKVEYWRNIQCIV